MALVYLRMTEDSESEKDFIVNTKNIKSIPVSVTTISGIKVKTVLQDTLQTINRLVLIKFTIKAILYMSTLWISFTAF